MWPFRKQTKANPYAPENIMDQLRAPMTTCLGLPRQMTVHAGNVDVFERMALRYCGHFRDPSPTCLTCRDVEFVIGSVGSGPVNVYPSR